jgi:hypothetical protein
MALSTYATAKAQYETNASWEGSVTKAVLFVESIRWILAFRSSSASSDASQATFDTTALREQLASAAAFVAASQTPAVSRRASFVSMRPLG